MSPTGAAVAVGPPGESAYQLWLDLGNTGTLQQYLQTLVGPMGPPGPTGPAGPVGSQGYTGLIGPNGVTGPPSWQTPPTAWAASTTYTATAPAAVVTYSGGSYVCSTSHTSTSTFDSSKWIQIAAPGVFVATSKAPIQRIAASTATMSTTTTQTPISDTAPTTSNTASLLSVSITPKASGNLLRVRAVVQGSLSVTGGVVGALFQSGGANAIAANIVSCAAGYSVQVVVTAEVTASGTTAVSYSVGTGSNNTGTLTINGIGGGRLFGGVMITHVEVEEYAA